MRLAAAALLLALPGAIAGRALLAGDDLLNEDDVAAWTGSAPSGQAESGAEPAAGGAAADDLEAAFAADLAGVRAGKRAVTAPGEHGAKLVGFLDAPAGSVSRAAEWKLVDTAAEEEAQERRLQAAVKQAAKEAAAKARPAPAPKPKPMTRKEKQDEMRRLAQTLQMKDLAKFKTNRELIEDLRKIRRELKERTGDASGRTSKGNDRWTDKAGGRAAGARRGG